jgi:glycine/sarcosine N-methyltransferase
VKLKQTMSTVEFYDGLAPYYHLLYPEWETAIQRQGVALASLLATAGVLPGARVLDAACGVGTQSLGLAARGYRVHASDLSPGALGRCATEAATRGLSIETSIADLRTLSTTHRQPAAAVIACDNALPHLLTDAEIGTALRECYQCTAPGGLAIFSVRDYAVIERKNPDVRPYGVRDEGDRRYLAWQIWDWESNGTHYQVNLYLIEDRGGSSCETHVLRTRYYAIGIDRILALMEEAGFSRCHRRDGIFFQPLLIGYRDREP